MYDNSRLLVVDDEPVVLESCRRIFSPRGFDVETSSDADHGLRLAERNQYAAIFLDILMPSVDGITFLEKLRQTNPTVPVIVITGHSSVPSCKAVMRLGASDYISKPFTPAELCSALERSLGQQVHAAPAPQPASAAAVEPSEPAWVKVAGEYYFFMDNAWVRIGMDETVRAGLFLAPSEGLTIESVHLPRVGQVVYQGLPLAAVQIAGQRRMVPAPVSGEIIGVNESLAQPAEQWASDPCRKGWIARIAPSRLADDIGRCRPHPTVLAAADSEARVARAAQLTHNGCRVHTADNACDAIEALHAHRADLLVVDAASFGDAGPELVAQAKAARNDAKVLVIAEPGCPHEAAYRAHNILYYAVEPIDSREGLDMLVAAFKSAPRASVEPRLGLVPSGSLRRIRVTTRAGKRVTLLAGGPILQSDLGLGLELRRAVLRRCLPVETTLGAEAASPINVLREAAACDKLFVLKARDFGRLPGSLVCNPPDESDLAAGEAKATTLAVQPADSAAMEFDPRTTRALAEEIVRQMNG